MRKMAGSGKELVQRAVELLRRGEVAAEGLFDDDARILGAAGLGQPFGDRREQAGRDGQVVQRPLGGAQRLAQALRTSRVAVIAVDVLQPGAELARTHPASTPPCFSRLSLRARPELIEVPARLRHADDRHVEVTVPDHRLQRREDLLVRQVAGGAEEDEGVRMERPSCCLLALPAAFLLVAAEFVAHRGQHLVGEVGLAARAEAFVQRGAEDRGRHDFVDGGRDRPAPLARIGHAAGEARQVRALRRARRRSGRAATSRSRCRAARPRRCRAGSGRTGSARDCAAASSRHPHRAAACRRSRCAGCSVPRRRPP